MTFMNLNCSFAASIDAKFRHSLAQFRYDFGALFLRTTNAHFTYFEKNRNYAASTLFRDGFQFFSLKALAVVSKPAFKMNCKRVQKF